MNRSKREAVWPLCILLFVLGMWPWNSRTLDVRNITVPLQIQISKTSPIFAARNDEELPVIREFPATALQLRRGQILLRSGMQAIDPHIFQTPAPPSRLLSQSETNRHYFSHYSSIGMIVNKLSLPEGTLYQAARIAASKPRQLRGISISRTDSEVMLGLQLNRPGYAVALEKANSPLRQHAAADFSASVAPEDKALFMAQLPEHLRARAELSPDLGNALAQDYSISGPSVALESRITNLVQQERLLQDVHSVNHQNRVPQMVQVGRVFVSNPTPSPLIAATGQDPQSPSSLPQPKVMNTKAESPTATPGLVGLTGTSDAGMIQGTIELKDGLAFFGSMKGLTVTQKIAGQDVTRATLSIQEGRYTIVPLHPGEGELVAELRTPDGLLMGRDSQPLGLNSGHVINFSVAPLSASAFGTVQIAKSLNHVVSTPAASSYLDASKAITQPADVFIAGMSQPLRTDAQTNYKKAGYIRGSSYLVAAREPGFATSVALASTDRPQVLRLFPNQIVDAWISRALTPSHAQGFGTIYGRVMNAGLPFTNTKIFIDDPSARVLYLDENQKVIDSPTTDATGSFAIVGLRPGFHSVAADLSVGRVTRSLDVEAGSVSHVELNWAAKNSLTTYIYDALTSAPLSTQVTLQGEERTAHTETGKLKIGVQNAEGAVALAFDAGPQYAPANRLCSRSTTTLSVPMLRSDWIQSVEDQAGLSRDTGRGYIVGFVRGEGFVLDQSLLTFDGHTRVAYFDATGNIVANKVDANRKTSSAVGFIVLNVPQGLHSVAVQLLGHGETANQVVLVQPGEVSLMDWAL